MCSYGMEEKLAKILKENGLDDSDLQGIERTVREQGISLMYAIENTRKIPVRKLLEIMAAYFEVSCVDLSNKNLQVPVINLIPPKLAEGNRIIPVDRVGNNIIVATGNPKDLKIAEKIRFATGYFAKLVLASEGAISVALQKHYLSKAQAGKDTAKRQQKAADVQAGGRIAIKTRRAVYDNEVMELADKVLVQCFQKRGSDIHVEPYEDYVRVRIRIDGSLTEIARVSSEFKTPLIARLKVMCKIDIAETRLPQDGNLGILIDSVPIDFRMSTLPTVYGEKVVMRLLDQSSLKVDMMDLGFERRELDLFRRAIQKPWGMVLVTGPTGSGKTTTLYSALADRNSSEENILTAEDPVEYSLDGVNQVQTREKIGLTFASIMRSFLRQDPDVIMIGEIRDGETADIAVKAALTGHMVLSTLHTNNSYETITRLVSMGVAPYNLVGALLCVVAQRLMRKLCDGCKAVDTLSSSDFLESLGIRKDFVSKVKVYRAQGCVACDGMGFKGRTAIHEVLPMSEKLYDTIIQGLPAVELKKIAIKEGMRTLRQSALIKMVQGLVSSSEVARVTTSDTD